MKGIFFNEPIEQYYLGHQFSEVYKEKVYEPLISGRKDLTIVDVGGNIGVTTYYFSRFAKKVVTVEPSKEHFEALKQMVDFNKMDNVSLVNKAVYIKSGEFPLFHNENKTMYSLHMAVNDGKSQPETVKAITLSDLFLSEKIEMVDLLKIDIEGSEIEVFSSPSFSEVAPRIKIIVTERHSWAGRHPNQLDDALKNNGFTIEKLSTDADLVIARRT